jgi:hypothetical protein
MLVRRSLVLTKHLFYLSGGVLLAGATFLSCSSFSAGPPIKCERAVIYSGYAVEVVGFDFPLEIVGGQKTFHIGKVGFKPEQVQEAKTLVG